MVRGTGGLRKDGGRGGTVLSENCERNRPSTQASARGAGPHRRRRRRGRREKGRVVRPHTALGPRRSRARVPLLRRIPGDATGPLAAAGLPGTGPRGGGIPHPPRGGSRTGRGGVRTVDRATVLGARRRAVPLRRGLSVAWRLAGRRAPGGRESAPTRVGAALGYGRPAPAPAREGSGCGRRRGGGRGRGVRGVRGIRPPPGGPDRRGRGAAVVGGRWGRGRPAPSSRGSPLSLQREDPHL